MPVKVDGEKIGDLREIIYPASVGLPEENIGHGLHPNLIEQLSDSIQVTIIQNSFHERLQADIFLFIFRNIPE